MDWDICVLASVQKSIFELFKRQTLQFILKIPVITRERVWNLWSYSRSFFSKASEC